MSLVNSIKSIFSGLTSKLEEEFGQYKRPSLTQRIKDSEKTITRGLSIAKPIFKTAVNYQLNKPLIPVRNAPSIKDVVDSYVSAGKFVGNTATKAGDIALDWTVRPIITRPVGKAIVSGADAANLRPIAGPQKGQKITSLPINDPAGRLLFGKEPLTSYQQDTRDATGFFEDIGLPKQAAGPLGLGIGTANVLLDLPGGSLIKKPGREAVERVGKKALTELAEDIAQKEVKEIAPNSARSLWALLHSKNVAVKSGLLTVEQADKLSAQKTMKLLEEKLPHAIPDFTKSSTKKNLKNTIKAATNLEFDDAFRGWVNARRSTELAGVTAKQQFKDLDRQGINAIFDVQSKKPGYETVRAYFDNIHEALKDAGIDIRYKSDYLPQLWNNSKEEVEKAFKTLNKNAPFTRTSVIKNYQQGMSAGLSPRFNTVSDLVGWYEKTAQKAIADSRMIDFLKKNDLIRPSSQAREGWAKITAQGFPVNRVKSEAGDWIEESFSAAPEIAQRITQYLDPAQFKGLEQFAGYNTAVKNVRLAAGIPGTGVNAHGWNILVRSTLSRNNPLGGFFDAGKWILNPNNADSFVKSSLDKATEYSRAGMTLSTEDFAFRPDPKIIDGNIAKRAYTVLGTTIDKWLGDPLFRKVIPALKIKYADELVEQYVKSGISRDEAVKQAATVANNIFGGQNELDRMFKSKDAQNLFRSLILAPDWTESTLKTGYNIGKSLIQPTNPILKPYRTFARNFTILWIASQAMDRALSGGIDDPFTMNAGYTGDGKKREVRIFGTGADMFRLPYEVAANIAKGNLGAVGRVVGNRLSLGFGTLAHLVANQDYRGRPILGNDKYGNPIPAGQQTANLFSESANALGIPSQVTSLIDRASGRIGNEELASQLIEAPTRYSGGTYSDASKRRQQTYQTAGLKGQELYNAMNKGKEKPGILSWLFGSKETAKVESSDPLIRAFNAEIEKDEKASRIREIFKLGLDRDGIEKVLESEGLGTFEEASFMIAKSLGVENGIRGAYIKEILSPLRGDDYKSMALKLADAGVLTTGVIKEWEDSGQISEAQADSMRALIKGKSSGSGTKKYKISIPGSLNLPEPKSTRISAPKFSLPNIAPIQPLRPKIKTPSYSFNVQRVNPQSIKYTGAKTLNQLGY